MCSQLIIGFPDLFCSPQSSLRAQRKTNSRLALGFAFSYDPTGQTSLFALRPDKPPEKLKEYLEAASQRILPLRAPTGAQALCPMGRRPRSLR